MKITDVKMLWARSGNRCAFAKCHLELAPAGASTTLGEIAHIIAKAPDGPRGDSPLPLESRDDYDNLILLCPTHHSIVDSNTANWPPESLQKLKREHEHWVASQLDAGSISIRELEGIEFAKQRSNQFASEAQSKVWVYVALTPLSTGEDAIEPKSRTIIDIIDKTRLPDVHCGHTLPNRFHTMPNQFGIQNEDLRELSQGQGHRIQVFRNGHTEMSICIESISSHITSLYREYVVASGGTRRLIHYLNVSECAEHEVAFLKQLWDQVLPFPNMIASYVLSDIQNSRLLFDSQRFESQWRSNMINAPSLQGNRVFDRQDTSDQMLHFVLERIVESYGWVLPNLRDKDGTLSLPRSLVQ
jgi:hypothetical protein